MVVDFAPLRPFTNFRSAKPMGSEKRLAIAYDSATENLVWLRLRQLTDIPARGKSLFTGTTSEKNAMHREFQNYVRQGQTYWTAGMRTDGSSSALLYYYGALNLAKAELLTSHPQAILQPKISHGLLHKHTASRSIRGDYLEVSKGVFPLLFEKRTGIKIPLGTKIPITNLLSLIPEIGFEIREFGQKRPPSGYGYHAIARDKLSAWSLVAIERRVLLDENESISRLLKRDFERVALRELTDWRQIFALSERYQSANVRVFQSKSFHTRISKVGAKSPDEFTAQHQFKGCLASHVSEPINRQADFVLTHALYKSKPLIIPLPLARYAAIFYLSSLVRYKPAALDRVHEGAQGWLMDSLTNEVPLNLLFNSLIGIQREPLYFESNEYRI